MKTRPEVIRVVKGELSRLLKTPADAIHDDDEFERLLDGESIRGIELLVKLEKKLAMGHLEDGVLAHAKTISGLVDRIMEKL